MSSGCTLIPGMSSSSFRRILDGHSLPTPALNWLCECCTLKMHISACSCASQTSLALYIMMERECYWILSVIILSYSYLSLLYNLTPKALFTCCSFDNINSDPSGGLVDGGSSPSVHCILYYWSYVEFLLNLHVVWFYSSVGEFHELSLQFLGICDPQHHVGHWPCTHSHFYNGVISYHSLQHHPWINTPSYAWCRFPPWLWTQEEVWLTSGYA